MSNDRDDFAARAARRKGWPVRRYALGAEPEESLSSTTAEERLNMMWQLTLDAWASSRQPLPEYSRA